MRLSQTVRSWFAIRRRRRHDVVFYAPTVGAVLKDGQFFPQGGAEKQVVMLAGALARRGSRVAIIVSGRPVDLPAEVEGVTISVRTSPARGRGFAGKVVEAVRISTSLAKVPSRWIVVRGATVDLGVIAIHALLTRRRLVFASANVSDFKHSQIESNPLYVLLYKAGVCLARLVVVQTDEQAELCRTAFLRRPRVVRSIAEVFPTQDQEPIAFLWVGRLVAYKRPLEYIGLARALPEAKFWMVGSPTPHLTGDQTVIEAVLAEAESLPNLELLRPRPHLELQRLTARAVASVNTATLEGVSNVLLEGWSMGVPALVLNYDPDGVVERHGLGAFAAGDVDAFVQSAERLWRSRHDRLATSQRCRTYIATHHAPETIARQWAALLEPSRGSH